LYSQCKLERSKDDFSSSQTVSSQDVTLASVFPLIGNKKPWELVMSFIWVDSAFSISVTHQSQSYSTSLSSIFFKFKDGTVIRKVAPSYASDYDTGLGYNYTSTGFEMTKDEIMIFASKDLLKIQAIFKYFPDHPVVEEEIKNKSIERIRKDASCILSETSSITYEKKDVKSDIKVDVKYECKYEKNIIDDFTKKRIVLTQPETIYNVKISEDASAFYSVCGSNISGSNGLQFNRGYRTGNPVKEDVLKNIMQFDQIALLLDNDEVINLNDTEIVEMARNGSAYVGIKVFAIESDSIWQKLHTIPLKKFRVSMKNKEIGTQEIEKKYAKSIMNIIDCVDALAIPKSK